MVRRLKSDAIVAASKASLDIWFLADNGNFTHSGSVELKTNANALRNLNNLLAVQLSDSALAPFYATSCARGCQRL